MRGMLLETATTDKNGSAIRALTPSDPCASISWRLVYYSPGMRLAMHRHEIAHFSTLLCGQAREMTRRGDFDSRPMLMEFKPVGFEHANEFGPDGALILSININPDNPYLQECFDPQKWRLRAGRDVAREWTLLSRNISEGGGAKQTEMETVTLDLLAALVQTDRADRRGNPPSWLVRAHEAIIETNEDLETIAEDAGVHRVHLSRSFRRYYGCSITERRRETRLSRAMRLLAHGGERAGAASYAAGFADQSHLTRIMRRSLGITPAAMGALFAA